jgi:hypothetical protein
LSCAKSVPANETAAIIPQNAFVIKNLPFSNLTSSFAAALTGGNRAEMQRRFFLRRTSHFLFSKVGREQLHYGLPNGDFS